jgi:predicted nucleic acid-binding protein
MTRVFADSYYFFAILNPKDNAHQKALQFATEHAEPLVTTAWVLTELADGLAATRRRAAFSQVVSRLQAEPENEIVPPHEELMSRGIELYDARPDKQWSLTDCISFLVMQDRQIAEALTGDRHFEQAGYVALLK